MEPNKKKSTRGHARVGASAPAHKTHSSLKATDPNGSKSAVEPGHIEIEGGKEKQVRKTYLVCIKRTFTNITVGSAGEKAWFLKEKVNMSNFIGGCA